MGVGSVVEAEIWALLFGFQLAWERGVRRLRIEVDSLLVFQWVTSGNGGRNNGSVRTSWGRVGRMRSATFIESATKLLTDWLQWPYGATL